MNGTSATPPNTSQQSDGPCRFCGGGGKVQAKQQPGEEQSPVKLLNCPKCDGSGRAAKVTKK